MMRLFLMWSDDRSCKIAGALHKEIPAVFGQKVVPFYSEDLPKGLAWFDKIVAELTRSDIGIACLTPESLHSPWLHLEIGVLYQVLGSAKKNFKILPFLFEIDQEQFSKHPLCNFQRAFATKQDTQRLFRTINNSLADVHDEPLSDVLLNERFNESWISIERQLSDLASANVPGFRVYQHSLELAESLSRAVHIITVSPVLAGNVCFQKLVDNAIEEMSSRVKRVAERDPVLHLSVADFESYLRELCAEKKISIKFFSVLYDEDGSPPPIRLESINFNFESANCTSIVSGLDQAVQLIKMPRNQLSHWDWRLMTQENYHASFGKGEHWFCLVSREEKAEILAVSAGRSHELIANAKTGEIEMHLQLWDKVYDDAVPMPAWPTTENDVAAFLTALVKPLRIQVTEPELIAITGGGVPDGISRG